MALGGQKGEPVIRQSYDMNVSALYITIRDGDVDHTDELEAGTLVDLDSEGALLGIEVLRPGRAWPLEDILDHYPVAEEEAKQLRAYFPQASSARRQPDADTSQDYRAPALQAS